MSRSEGKVGQNPRVSFGGGIVDVTVSLTHAVYHVQER